MADLSQFVLRVDARRSNPEPNDADSTMIELFDLSERKVLWRGTVAQLHNLMRKDPNAWTEADLRAVRQMASDRRIRGLYVDGSHILRMANPDPVKHRQFLQARKLARGE